MDGNTHICCPEGKGDTQSQDYIEVTAKELSSHRLLSLESRAAKATIRAGPAQVELTLGSSTVREQHKGPQM